MNFQELMSKATENCHNSIKQRKRPGHLHKDNVSKVSSSVVQAFLARKQQEEKKRQADEEAARRARIEARIEQNLKQKRGPKKEKPSVELPNPTSDEHEKPKKQRRKEKSTAEVESSSSTFAADKPRKKQIVQKKQDFTSKQRHQQQQQQQQQKERSDISATAKKKPSRKQAQPPNFKELLEMAEKNRLGLHVRPNSEHSKTNGASKVGKKPFKEKPKDYAKKEIQQRQFNNPKKEMQQRQDDFKKSKRKHLPETKNTTIKMDKEVKPQSKPNPTNYSRSQVHNKSPMKRPNPSTMSRTMQRSDIHRKRRAYDYYDEADDDDMDGFIDDGEVDSVGDVSAHIREIFGYDRHRYGDDDVDDSAMESSYTQIEREEQRSSKIAKLEDEIAFLKEQAELKREKERLMKGKKRKK